jgi:hypothetical protein
MADLTGEVQMADVGKAVTVKVRLKGFRRFWFRWTLVKGILGLAIFVAPVNVEIIETEEGD